LDALAGQLNLRMNTVWSFKHKVSERIHELSNGGNHPLASKWDEVILLNEPVARKANLKKEGLKSMSMPLG
jgi:two-component system, sensor histidine kinase LadS